MQEPDDRSDAEFSQAAHLRIGGTPIDLRIFFGREFFPQQREPQCSDSETHHPIDILKPLRRTAWRELIVEGFADPIDRTLNAAPKLKPLRLC
jgi:hypothetical protein